MGKKTTKRLLHAKELLRSGTLIPPSVRDLHLKQCALSHTYRVDMKVYPSTTSNIGIGDVSRVISSDINVNATICCAVNFDTGTVSCPCRFYEEHFQPCSDAIAVIVACGRDPNDILFFDSINTTANYIHQYSCAPMSFGRIVLSLQETKQLDPKHVIGKKPGRPNKKIKKRMERQELGLGVRVCPGCGMKGHFISSCTQFNLGMAAYKRESKVKLALKIMSSETIEVDDSSCYIVSHDTQYEDIVETDDFDDEDLDFDE